MLGNEVGHHQVRGMVLVSHHGLLHTIRGFVAQKEKEDLHQKMDEDDLELELRESFGDKLEF